MSIIALVAVLIAAAAAVAVIVIKAGTPAPTVASMLRGNDKTGEGR